MTFPIFNSDQLEMLYLNTTKQLFHFVDQLEVCLPYSSLLTGIPILVTPPMWEKIYDLKECRYRVLRKERKKVTALFAMKLK